MAAPRLARQPLLQSMKDRLLDDPAVAEVLDDDPFEQRGCHAGIPDAVRIDDDDRPPSAHAEAWRLSALDALRTEKKPFALQEYRKKAIQFAPAVIGRTISAGANKDVPGIRIHRW